MTAAQRYAGVLRSPLVGRLLLSTLLVRGPIGIDGLATVLLVRETTGSYAAAGVVAAAFAIGAALLAPLLGRVIDRLGAPRVLVPLAIVHATALVVLVLLARADAPTAVLAFDALIAGAAIPPAGSVLRALWPDLVPAGLLTTAYALDSVLVEVAFVVGPLLVALAAAISEPGLALLFAAAAVVAGTYWFTSTEPVRGYSPASHAGETGGLLGALHAPGVRTIVLSIVPIGFCLGAAEVAFPAFGEAVGDPALAGPLIALWSLGSGLGGLAYGAYGHRISAAHAYVRGLALLPLVTLPLAIAPSFAAMVPLALLAGVAVAPLLAAGNQVIGEVAPRGALTEAFTWPITALVAGVAAGNAASGAIVQADDWSAAFVTAGVVGLLGFAIVFSRRRTLVAAPEPAG